MALAHTIKQDGPDRTIYVTGLASHATYPNTPDSSFSTEAMLDCDGVDEVRINIISTFTLNMRFYWYTPPGVAFTTAPVSETEYPTLDYTKWYSSDTGGNTGPQVQYGTVARTEVLSLWPFGAQVLFNRRFASLPAPPAHTFTAPILGRFLYPVVTNPGINDLKYILTIQRIYVIGGS